ncbi:heme exporter protein CcmD [Pseudorhizobium endolithicum]|uniref:Heme exporter protein D n=1 Tax=Pseudorhizobium endolithicum TaxID=1191678 RepID=A0ABN7JTZ0_9HYPH|nr:heme exporter protein CcmD [Pseudorhizobium endolithicum]CAD7042957.1 heme exporter protein CcmD [Pseudorhizobium endolithicum]
MSHGFYIALSYAISALIVAVMLGRIWLDGRARQRELAELEASGIRRRSSAAGKGELA